MKTFAELRAECERLKLPLLDPDAITKVDLLNALRKYHWRREHADRPMPPQIQPMLLGDWNDLTRDEAEELANDHHVWGVQPKLDGVRVLIHIESSGARITGRTFSDVNYRLTEHQANLRHLTDGLTGLNETIFDGELVCPKSHVDTGRCITETGLQAVVAILTTSPDHAEVIQRKNSCQLQFHAFDILRCRGLELTAQPLATRLDILGKLLSEVRQPGFQIVPTAIVGKPGVHARFVESGGEGTVWKRLDGPYEAGRRVRHWLKKKRETDVVAFVSGAKIGTSGRGHLVGAVEFSMRGSNGDISPIAWVSNWTDDERAAMTSRNEGGEVELTSAYLGRSAIISGQDVAARSHRLRHARIKRWL